MTTNEKFTERCRWVMNNKQLFAMWNLTRDTLESFVHKNAPVIDQVITYELEKADKASRKAV